MKKNMRKLLSLVCALCLVGGIGIMNMMLTPRKA